MRIERERKLSAEHTLRGIFALDSGVIIEMLLGTSKGERVVEALSADSILAYTSDVNIAETEYILCRKLGDRKADEKIDALLRSNYLSILEPQRLRDEVVKLKCGRGLTLADCYCLAVAKVTGSRALFAFKEEELSKEISRKPFEVPIDFLS